MVVETFTIKHKEGLPARSATFLVNTASEYDSRIKFNVSGKEADAKSIINLMALHIKFADELKVIIEGEDAFKAMKAIKDLLIELAII